MVSRRRCRGTAMVEFAVVGPVLFMVMMLVLDFGRGLLYNEQMANGAREAVRQAVLKYNNRSNLAAASCGTCQVPGVVPRLNTLAGIGYGPPIFALSTSSGSPPSYGTYTAGTSGQPGTIALSSTAVANRTYVFIYELNPSTGATNWATCDPCSGVRIGGGQLVVVDLKMRWQPMVFYLAGASTAITLDAQAVAREEW